MHSLKLLFFFSPLFLASLELPAQELQLHWGPTYRYKNKHRPLQVLYQQGEEIYLLCGKPGGRFKHYSIEVYDTSKFERRRSISLPRVFAQSAELYFEEVSVHHGAAYFFLRDRKYLYCGKYRFGRDTAAEVKRISPLPKPIKPQSSSDAHSSVFFSEQGAYMVVYYNLPNHKNEYEKVQYSLLDTNLQQVERRILSLPYKDKHYQDYKYWVNAEGNLSLLGFKQVEKKGLTAPVLFHYPRQSEQGFEVNFPLPQGYLLQFHFISQKGELVYHGLYSSGDQVAFYRYRYHEERGRLLSDLSIHLSAPDLAIKYPQVYDDDLNFKEFDVIDIKYLSYDTLLVFLEQQTFSTQEPKGYYYEDIVVFKATTRGELLWITKIPKRQALISTFMPKGFQNPEALAQGSDLLSATVLTSPKGTFLLYNDHKDNAKSHHLQTLRFKQDAAMYLVELKEEGQWNKRVVSDFYYLSQAIQYSLGDKGLIAVGFNRRKREWRWVRVE